MSPKQSSVIIAAMKALYHYKNIIDLEFFLHRDTAVASDRLQKRDREIFLQLEKEQGADVVEKYPPQKLLDWWVQHNTAGEFPGHDKKSPGEVFLESLGLAKLILISLGIVTGLAGGAAFFTYTGATPVNVFQFLVLFIGSQLVLTAIWSIGFFFRILLPTAQIPSFYWLCFLGGLKRLHGILHKQWLRNIGAEKRNSVGHALGIIRAQNSIYGPLFYWPLFCLSQLLTIGFNCGLLAITLLKVTTTDLAFGWQSTIQFSDQAIHTFVQWLSIPWAWIFPEAVPSLAEISGSRIILKDTIYHLATEDLVAWWPFLVLCLLLYGLCLRLALLLLGRFIENRRLNRFVPDTPLHTALLRRMQTPIVTTQAAPEPKKEAIRPDIVEPEVQEPEAQTGLLPQLLLIPDDIYDACPAAELDFYLEKHGAVSIVRYRFQVGYDEDQQLKEQISTQDWQQNPGIFILMEGWMVPLVDFLTYLKELRGVTNKTTIITVALTGRPSSSPFTSVAQQDMVIWKQKLEAMGDPYIQLISFVTETDIS